VLIVLFLVAGQLPDHPAARAQESPGVSDGRFARLARGVNLSFWFWYGPGSLAEVERKFTESDFRQLRDLGFTYVRVPIDLGFLLDENDPDGLNDEALAVLDRGIQGLLDHDLAVIVDLHSTDQTYYENIFSGRLEADPAFIDTFEAFWRALAAHLSSTDPERVFLEILNEPVYQDRTADWPPVQARLAAAIRAAAPDHTLIVTSASWSNIDTFIALEPLDDPNVIYNFHFYEPFLFTHQGADWAGEPIQDISGIPYPSSPENVEGVAQQLDEAFPADSPYSWAGSWARDYGRERWDINRIDERVRLAVDWTEQHGGLRLMCNEFGTYSRFAAPADRLQWIHDVRTTLEKYGIAWAMWDYLGIESGFGIVEKFQNGLKSGTRMDGDVAATLGLFEDQTADSAGLPSGYDWTPLFRDDFDGSSLDAAAWNTCYYGTPAGEGCTNEGNHELEWYVPEQVIVSDGWLHLRAEPRSVNGFDYVSGMVSSHQKTAFQYGYVEMRARIPAGQGLWPAFWMMPDSGEWPPEIDVMEIVGHEPNRVYLTYHRQQKRLMVSRSSWWTGPDFSADFHTYGLLWQPDLLVWYVDGVERYRTSDQVPAESMYLIVNLAVGGDWPGTPDDTTTFPAEMEIDYIAVWQAQ
jgi:beta-glucanase (GH16 family)